MIMCVEKTQHAQHTQLFFFSCPLCCFHVTIPPAVRPALLRQMDMGSLTCAQIWMHAIHMKGGHAQASVHNSLDSEWQKNCPSPSPAREPNPGSSDRKDRKTKTEGKWDVSNPKTHHFSWIGTSQRQRCKSYRLRSSGRLHALHLCPHHEQTR